MEPICENDAVKTQSFSTLANFHEKFPNNYYFGKNNFYDNDVFYGDKMSLPDTTKEYLELEKIRKNKKKEFHIKKILLNK